MRLRTLPSQLDQVYQARLRLEKSTISKATRKTNPLWERTRQQLELIAQPRAIWTVRAHAQAIQVIRGATRELSSALGEEVRVAGFDAVSLAIEQFSTQWRIMSRGASKAPMVDNEAAKQEALEASVARTANVTDAGEVTIANTALAVSLQDATHGHVVAAAVVTGLLSTLREKTQIKIEEIFITEVAASANLGTLFMGRQAARRAPIKKVWDATLDRRVCRKCSVLHRETVLWEQTFPGGLDYPPAHPRCRCVAQPWLDDWTRDLEEADIEPGPRMGVQANAETVLPWRRK